MDLKGATALVTGGHVRIGRVISLALAEGGCHVAVQYNRSEEQARETVEELKRLGVNAASVQAELADSDQVEALAHRAEEEIGPIHILVNNASAFFRTPFDEITEADWDTLLAVNLKAPFLLAHRLGRAMRDRGRGKIVNIADWSGEKPYRHYLPYCVSKGGLIALTKALAKELAPAVQVNAVCPGPILWPDDMTDDEKAAIIAKTPLGRRGDPADIAAAVLFFVQATDFATGAVLPIDGGRSL